jgi:hypothetical protein
MRPMLLGIPPHLSWGAGFEPEDVLELERKIAQASRISQQVPDPTTYERLRRGLKN